jgi:RND family efflux transporter MFP subunit
MNKSKVMVLVAMVTVFLASCNSKKEEVKNEVCVKTATVGKTSISGNQSYAGTIEEMSGTTLSFAGAGTIKTLNIDEGKMVRAGECIGSIDASSTGNAVAMAHAATMQAREALKQAEDAYKRMKLLHDNGSLPEMKWVEVQTKVSQAKQMVTQAVASERIARKGLTDTRLIAPFSGYISKKQAEIGQNVLPGQPVASLVKIDQVKVKISVPEEEIAQLKIGQRIAFRVSSLSNKTFFGVLSEKSVAADPISRAYSVKAIVANHNHELLPGMVCDAYTSISDSQNKMVLPANIIQINIDNQPFVWVVSHGKAVRKNVVLGENVGENVTIVGGISPMDKVIVEGQQKVSNGMKVSVNKD